MTEAMKYCEACQALPKHGYCDLSGCPMERPDCGCGLGSECPDPPQSSDEGYAAGVSMMLEHEHGGGEGWWKGWEMVKAAHAKADAILPLPSPPDQKKGA